MSNQFSHSDSFHSGYTGAAPSALLCFLRGFLTSPRKVASVLPSSRSLQRRLSSLPGIQKASQVVELGPGVGSTTQALLRGMQPEARLLGIELVPEFVSHLQKIDDQRLQLVTGSALDLHDHLRKHQMASPEVIVSGIPFSTLSAGAGLELVQSIHDALPVGGQFIAYQVRDDVSQLAGEFFGPPETSLVLWNLPPLRIFQWTKGAAAR